ncbi:MAG: competence/damage-inducible protein A [Myxococcota bacterium]
MSASPRHAAVLLIGDELLTGKIRDENLPFLAKELFVMGIRLERAVVCRDDVATIVAELRSLRANHDLVFTTGGIGPTHDDVTLRAVAEAFDRKLVSHPELEQMIRDYFQENTNADHLAMALTPEGAELIRHEDISWPVLSLDGVFVFPGVPQLLVSKFPAVRTHLGTESGFVSGAFFINLDEFALASALGATAKQHPDVAIGSYVQWGKNLDYKVKVTFDAASPSEVKAAMSGFEAAIGSEFIVKRRTP